jgi:hypothetical protein
VIREDDLIGFNAPAFAAQGATMTVSATLIDPASTTEGETVSPIAGKSITFTLGSATSSQTCSAATNTSGISSCNITGINQSLGSQPLIATFAGDPSYQAASTSGSTIAFSYLDHGSFIVGNLSCATNATVTWWSPMWSAANQLSGSSAPSSFKGFAANLSSSPPATGGTWSTTPAQSSSPPTSVPSYMAVFVTNKVTKTGSTILSGPNTAIAIVKIDPGYNPAEGTAGTGTVVGFLP